MNKKMLGLVAVAAFLAVEMSAGTANAQGMLRRMRTRLGRAQQTQCCPATCQTSNCQTAATSTSSVVAPVSYSEPIAYSEPAAGPMASEAYSEPASDQVMEYPIGQSPMVEGAVIESASACGCDGQASISTPMQFSGSIEPAPLQQTIDTVSFETTPAVGCEGCGMVQQASYIEPVAEGEYFGGDSGCIGCELPVQGCSAGDCGSVVSEGSIDGQVIEGEIVGDSFQSSVIEASVIDSGTIQGGTIEGGVIEGEIAPAESASDVPEPPTQAPAIDDDQDA